MPSPVVGLFSPKAIIHELASASRDEALDEMVRTAIAAGVLPRTRKAQVVEALLGRETRGSTGLGRGVAIPHAKIPGLRAHAGVVARSSAGVDFRAVDGELVHVMVMLISPDNRQDEHLATLRWVSLMARDHDFCSFIRQARTAEQIFEVLQERAG
ncbi:MAG TPA: PTS sugar transporter subunit IIA [Planctomycetota bacterium]|nr:PTS sugar transporter subunit IIA [Planctomycetota bacterium]